MADDEEVAAQPAEVEEVEEEPIDLTEEEDPGALVEDYMIENFACSKNDKKRKVGYLWRRLKGKTSTYKKEMIAKFNENTEVIQSANRSTRIARKQLKDERALDNEKSEGKRHEGEIIYREAKAEDFLEMVEAWSRKRAGKPLSVEEKKLAEQFESLSEAERLSLSGGGSRKAGGGGKGWGSEPLADTDGFVVESERSPNGTHRQRKRTGRSLAELRAAGAG